MFKKLTVILLCFSLLLVVGCARQSADSEKDSEESKAIMADFNALIQDYTGVEQVADFINQNIARVSAQEASEMVNQFEKIQQDGIAQFEEIIFTEDMQMKMHNAYQGIISKEAEVEDAALKELLTKLANSGYKLETAEGSYFPVIDYRFYQNFRNYVTDDLKAYIDIMAVESSQVPAKDGALVIGWSEVINRALNLEKFINTYSDSVKIEEVKELYDKYLLFTFNGLNNTPLFDYTDQTMDSEALEAYTKAVENTGDSKYLAALSDYLEILKSNNYKLTDEVEAFRDQINEKLN